MEVESPSNYHPPEKPVTYKDIVVYVQEKYGVKVSDAAISIVKAAMRFGSVQVFPNGKEELLSILFSRKDRVYQRRISALWSAP